MKNCIVLASQLAFVLLITSFTMDPPSKGPDVTSIDEKADPRNDFFQYANGNWIKNNPIPATEGRWGSFNVLAERNFDLLRKILEDAAADQNATAGSARQKTGDFYRLAMDTVKLERESYQPIQSDLTVIDQIKNTDDLMSTLGAFHRKGISGFFSMHVGQDVKQNERYVTWFSQGGLGLPDRDYYLKTDEKSVTIRNEYVKHINKMFAYVNIAGEGKTILEIETKMAEASMSKVDNRNMEKKYNKFSVHEFKRANSNINWDIYFTKTGLSTQKVDTVVVAHPAFFSFVNQIISNVPLEQWKLYMKWKLVNSTASYLHSDLTKESFAFYSTMLQGITQQKPRWKRAVSSANALIGEIVAQEYVKEAFSAESKAKVNLMVDDLREAFRSRINNLPWMSAETKTKAIEKLNSFNRKLGYPDKWEDYSKLEIKFDTYLANYYRARMFDYDDMISNLSKPVDKMKWKMLPQTVNAYYSAVMNEIVFPAAIMQPPFFTPDVDDAVNYGAIGAVIGHEFSHGFDDQGSKYDAKGNLSSWWTEQDRKLFEERTQKLVDQFNQFRVVDSVFVNGQLTLGENIADLAGLTVAYEAYQLRMKGKKREIINGFTPEQRFFIGYAQVWCSHARPEFLRNQVLTDPHSPAQFRVFGPLSNMQEFYNAFNVKPGDKMWRDEKDRVKIW